MKKLKRVTTVFLAMLCLLCLCHAPKAMAANMCRVIIDANGGLFYFEGAEYGFYDSELAVEEGNTIAGAGNAIAIVGYGGMTFQGWNVYNAGGTEIASGLSTSDVNNYKITESVNFVAQWEPVDSGDTKEAITYAAWFGETNEVDYGCKITIIHEGVKYSGYGYVSISEDIYSSWTGTVQIIQEFPGHFVNANNRWNPDYFSSEGSAREFRKQGDCSFPMSTTGTGRDVPPNSVLLSEFYYNVRNHTPDISLVQSVGENETPAVSVGTDSPAVPEDVAVHSEVLISGTTYDEAVAAVSSSLGTTNVLVYDIIMKDSDGNAVSRFDEKIEVTIVIPENFPIGADKTAMVYYLSPDGQLEECDTTYHVSEDGSRYVTFLTDHFSYYVLVECDVVVETVPETTEPVQATEADLVETEESQTETKESLEEKESLMALETTSPSDESLSEGNPKGRGRMVWILAGGIGLLAILGFIVAGKKK